MSFDTPPVPSPPSSPGGPAACRSPSGLAVRRIRIEALHAPAHLLPVQQLFEEVHLLTEFFDFLFQRLNALIQR